MTLSGPLSRQTSTSPSRLSSTPGLHPKSAACALNLPAGLRGAGPPSGRRAVEARLLGSKREEDFSSRSPSLLLPPLPPGSGSEPQMRGAGLAPQSPGGGGGWRST